VIREAEGEAQVTLIGTGTELSLAIEAQAKLKDKGVHARVVSAPSLETFLASRMQAIAPPWLIRNCPSWRLKRRLRWGWDGLIGLEGGFVGMEGFGASAPAEALYEHFGVTADAVVEQALKRV
jgi:transketolase